MERGPGLSAQAVRSEYGTRADFAPRAAPAPPLVHDLTLNTVFLMGGLIIAGAFTSVAYHRGQPDRHSRMARPMASRWGTSISSYSREITIPAAPASSALSVAR